MTRSSLPDMVPASRATRAADAVLARRSPRVFRIFARIFAYDLARSFHAIRLQGPAPRSTGPIVIVANHPSWWDAALFTWLSATMFADKRAFAPIDAGMLKRYPFFGRLGAFGVKTGSFSGASTFLSVARRLLSAPDGLLLVNAEGRFRDVRARPLAIASGLAHLAQSAPGVTFLPLAIEVAFWDERRPNVLLRFGEPIPGHTLAGLAPPELRLRLADALSAAMDTLAVAATTRDPDRFQTLLAGKTGINAFYDVWRGAKAWVRGKPFDPAHGADP